jgi:hypothetical protein
MAEGEMTLFQQNDTGEYVEYTPPTFKESLPEDVRDNDQIKGFESPNDVVTAYLDTVSKRPVVPETADAYTVELPEGFQVLEEDLAGFKKTAHELGLTQEQFEAAAKYQINRETAALEKMNADVEKNRIDAETALKAEWGVDYEKNVEKAKTFYKSIMGKMPDEGKALFEFMEHTKFGDNAHVIRFMAAAANLISEDAMEKGPGKPGQTERQRGEGGTPMLDFPSMQT